MAEDAPNDDKPEDRPRIIGAKVLRGGASPALPAAEKPPPPAAAPARRGVVSAEDYEASLPKD